MSALAEQLPLEQPCRSYDNSRYNLEDIIQFMDAKEAASMTHSELERALEKKGRELMRTILQDHLDNRSPGECSTPVIDSENNDRSRLRLQGRNLETTFGTVSVERTGYGKKGQNSLHPMDAELNLPNELYSLELRRRVAMEAAKSSFDETIELVKNTTGASICKRQVEELVLRAAEDFDNFYHTRHYSVEQNQTTGSVLAVSVDGKGIVMRTQDLKEKTRKAAEARTPKMKTRLSKGEKRNAKRMATVATVYTTETFERAPEDLVSKQKGTLVSQPERPKVKQKRVWASIEKEPVQVIEEALLEAGNRDPTKEKTWVALVDGNKNQLSILENLNKKQSLGLTIIVDIIHVIEYLWTAGRAFCPENDLKLELWVQERFLKILQGKSGIVAGAMKRSATLRKLSPKEREPVDKCATYLFNKKPYLRYDQYLAKGLPIATGVIEGACRHLVKDRMDLTGARWSLAGAEAVLRLRALRSSHDFDEYWKYHEQCEYERNHKSLYKEGAVPAVKDTSHTRQARLRLVE